MILRPASRLLTPVLVVLWVFFAHALAPVTLAAQKITSSDDLIEAADRQIRNAQYDDAIRALEVAIAEAPEPGRLQMYYLLLIKGRVLKAGELVYRNEPGTADDVLEIARIQILECLTTPGLQHTRPGPDVDPPALMVDLFDQVRSRIFGSLRIDNLDPPQSMVIFKGDTLRAAEAGGSLIEQDIAEGSYVVVVQADGYQTQTDNVMINAGSEVLKDYVLKKDRGAAWWILRGGILAAVATVVGIAIPGGGTNVLSPLPGPPDPPGSPGR